MGTHPARRLVEQEEELGRVVEGLAIEADVGGIRPHPGIGGQGPLHRHPGVPHPSPDVVPRPVAQAGEKLVDSGASGPDWVRDSPVFQCAAGGLFAPSATNWLGIGAIIWDV